MTYPIQPGPSSQAAQIREAARHFLFLRTSSFRTDIMTVRSLKQQQDYHHEKSRLIYGSLASIFLDQGFPVEYELDEFNALHTETTFSCLHFWLCGLRCQISLRHQLLHLRPTFSGDIHETTRSTNSRWFNVPVLNQ